MSLNICISISATTPILLVLLLLVHCRGSHTCLTCCCSPSTTRHCRDILHAMHVRLDVRIAAAGWCCPSSYDPSVRVAATRASLSQLYALSACTTSNLHTISTWLARLCVSAAKQSQQGIDCSHALPSHGAESSIHVKNMQLMKLSKHGSNQYMFHSTGRMGAFTSLGHQLLVAASSAWHQYQ